jgi:hypothetical protein
MMRDEMNSKKISQFNKYKGRDDDEDGEDVF